MPVPSQSGLPYLVRSTSYEYSKDATDVIIFPCLSVSDFTMLPKFPKAEKSPFSFPATFNASTSFPLNNFWAPVCHWGYAALDVTGIQVEVIQEGPANAKRNARQRCMCEGPVRTKFKFTTMFHLDLTADDA